MNILAYIWILYLKYKLESKMDKTRLIGKIILFSGIIYSSIINMTYNRQEAILAFNE